MNDLMVYIVILRGPDIGKEFDLQQDEIRIGRGTRNDIVIHDNEVSREHLIIRRLPQGFELTDLGSNNGTYINGRAVDRPSMLYSDCLIELGDSITLQFYISRTGSLPHNRRFSLLLTTDQQATKQVYPLEKNETIIGRSGNSDIQLVRAEMSREHFKITRTDAGFFVEDMGSTNGTWLNNQLVTEPTLITTSDIVHVGNTIVFQLDDEPIKDGSERITETLDAAQLKHIMHDQTLHTRFNTSMVSAVSPSDIGTGLMGESMFDKALIAYSRNLWLPIITPIINQMLSEDNQFDLWVDQYLSQGSPDWLLATEQARTECWLLVVVVSPETLHDEIIQKHILHFSNRDKPIIAFIYEPIDQFPRTLADAIRIDYNPALPNESLDQLMRQIRYLRSRSDDWNL